MGVKMITAIPQVTNASVKTACGEALINNTTFSFLTEMLKSENPFDKFFNDIPIFGDVTEFGCTLGDYTTQFNTGVLDTSETLVLAIRCSLMQTGGGVGYCKVVEKNTLVNMTMWPYNRSSVFPIGTVLKTVNDSAYSDSASHKITFILIDVSNVDSIELSFQLKQSGGTEMFIKNTYIHKQKYLYEKLEV